MELDPPGFPEHIYDQDQHDWLNGVLVALKRIYQIIRKRVDEQERRQQPAERISSPQSEDEPGESEQRF